MKELLNSVNSPNDIKNLTYSQLNELAFEIREEIIETVSKTGGHLSSNLGTVELTIALHKVFDCPHDEFVFDVGHQSYTHKLLTNRRDNFKTLRQKGGISGFPRHKESEYDSFIAGHASTSVSAAFGIATAKKLSGDDGYTVAIVGDGAFTGGLIYEGLNNSGKSDARLIVILNDNGMSISNNVGGLSHYLSKIRNRKGYFRLKDGLRSVLSKIPLGKKIERSLTKFKQMLKGTIYKSNFFEDLGFVYLGPIDGHNIKQLTEIFERAKKLNQPVVIHVNTIKGKGYAFAENSPSDFHGVSKFDHVNGDLNKSAESFTEHFSSALLELASNNDKICAVTAAMKDSTGLLAFSQKYPQRFFDVGIAEEHAVTFCAALAQKSYVPVLAIYSTFLQRAYDQVVHDVAIENQHVVFAVDRAGIVGEDGETHQGIFDVAFLTHIPNMTVFSPSNYTQLKECLTKAVCDCNGPVAVRYPRGGIEKVDIATKQFDGFEVLENENAKTVILTYGRLFEQAVKACDVLCENKKDVCVVNLIKIHPLSLECIEYIKKFQNVFLFEEGIENGSVSQKIVNMLYSSGYSGKTKITAINDKFVPHSSVKQALKDLKLDCEGMVEIITNAEEI